MVQLRTDGVMVNVVAAAAAAATDAAIDDNDDDISANWKTI